MIVTMLLLVALLALILYRLGEAENAINELASDMEDVRDYCVNLHRRLYPGEWNADGTPRA